MELMAGEINPGLICDIEEVRQLCVRGSVSVPVVTSDSWESGERKV